VRSRSLLVLVALAGFAAILHADYRDAFRRGIQAARRERWAEVLDAMREARKEEPRDTGERINISGMDFVPYVPSYYLGLALYYQKDCGAAVRAWQVLDNDGGIKRISGGDRERVTNFRKICATILAAEAKATPPEKPAPPNAKPSPPERPAGPDPAAVNAAAQAATTAIARAEEVERALAPLTKDEFLSKVWRNETALGATEQRGRDALQRARNELEAGRREPNLQRLQEAANSAAAALKEFSAVRGTAEKRRGELAADAKLEEERRTREAEAAARKAEEARKAEDARKTAAAETTARPASFTPPPPLAEAARLFFRAQYAEAAASLSKQRYPDGLAAGHAALLRAASNYALYLVGGEKDQKLQEQAASDVRDARRVAPALQPDPRAFSPRFVEFFNRTR
jgi:hypothetical protein